MADVRPTAEELAYLGLSELQIILLSDFPDDLVLEVYREQLECLMSDSDESVDF